MKFYIIVYCLLVALQQCFCQEFNLEGDAGQAYAIELELGNPPQKLNVLVDTGSSTLAVASQARQDNNIYFHAGNSTTLSDTGTEVQAKYSQGMWLGRLVSDYVRFPSLSTAKVKADIALITKSHEFFANGSSWQGLLGLAYLPVGAWGDHVVVKPWLDSVEGVLGKPTSFSLKLCGIRSLTEVKHYGSFEMLDDNTSNKNGNKTFRTPILRKRWYEVGVISVRVLTQNKSAIKNDYSFNNVTLDEGFDVDVCQELNKEKSIVDSGTTNIRLPDNMFRKIVNDLRNAARASNMVVLDNFWDHGAAACWPEAQEWALPWLAIDLLSDESYLQFFTLEIPPQNYMRLISAHNSSNESVTESEFCYKLGIEAGGCETVLGYTAMEGFQVTFNRSASWIGWQTSNCGPNARISGPYTTLFPLTLQCRLSTPMLDTPTSIKAAQWALFAVSMIAIGVLVYLLPPCIKTFLVRPLNSTQQISLSQTALVERETT